MCFFNYSFIKLIFKIFLTSIYLNYKKYSNEYQFDYFLDEKQFKNIKTTTIRYFLIDFFNLI